MRTSQYRGDDHHDEYDQHAAGHHHDLSRDNEHESFHHALHDDVNDLEHINNRDDDYRDNVVDSAGYHHDLGPADDEQHDVDPDDDHNVHDKFHHGDYEHRDDHHDCEHDHHDHDHHDHNPATDLLLVVSSRHVRLYGHPRGLRCPVHLRGRCARYAL